VDVRDLFAACDRGALVKGIHEVLKVHPDDVGEAGLPFMDIDRFLCDNDVSDVGEAGLPFMDIDRFLCDDDVPDVGEADFPFMDIDWFLCAILRYSKCFL